MQGIVHLFIGKMNRLCTNYNHAPQEFTHIAYKWHQGSIVFSPLSATQVLAFVL
jgi:hypothetical protein